MVQGKREAKRGLAYVKTRGLLPRRGRQIGYKIVMKQHSFGRPCDVKVIYENSLIIVLQTHFHTSSSTNINTHNQTQTNTLTAARHKHTHTFFTHMHLSMLHVNEIVDVWKMQNAILLWEIDCLKRRPLEKTTGETSHLHVPTC